MHTPLCLDLVRQVADHGLHQVALTAAAPMEQLHPVGHDLVGQGRLSGLDVGHHVADQRGNLLLSELKDIFGDVVLEWDTEEQSALTLVHLYRDT